MPPTLTIAYRLGQAPRAKQPALRFKETVMQGEAKTPFTESRLCTSEWATPMML
jgi:hypothetical protein